MMGCNGESPVNMPGSQGENLHRYCIADFRLNVVLRAKNVKSHSQEVMEEQIMNSFFTVNELVNHFRVNPKTIYRRLWAKAIPACKVGAQWRIAKKDLLWLKR